MKNKKIIIGSRGSKLALIYAERARKSIIECNPGLDSNLLDIKSIVTTGDKYQNKRLSDIGGKGHFSKKIEEQLLTKEIDLAVHALKDMPSIETPGLSLNVFLKRNDPREILISKKNLSFDNLKTGSVIGTSSFRRSAQIKKLRNDLEVKLIRGNVDTRIKKLEEKKYDGIILALTGIQSLGVKKKISQIFSTREMLPSVGQGIVVLQTRTNDYKIIDLINKTNHYKTFLCATAERSMLKILEGDCDTAVGALATVEGNLISMQCELFSLDGKKRFFTEINGSSMEPKNIGINAGKELIKQAGNSYK